MLVLSYWYYSLWKQSRIPRFCSFTCCDALRHVLATFSSWDTGKQSSSRFWGHVWSSQKQTVIRGVATPRDYFEYLLFRYCTMQYNYTNTVSRLPVEVAGELPPPADFPGYKLEPWKCFRQHCCELCSSFLVCVCAIASKIPARTAAQQPPGSAGCSVWHWSGILQKELIRWDVHPCFCAVW